jgi:hypothetical protein
MHQIRTEAFLAASPDDVWKVLADFDRYAEWNPLNLKARGKGAPGARIPMTILNPVRPDRPLSMAMRINRFEPGRALEWIGSVPLLFQGRHFFNLTPEGAGTRLRHGEDQSGLISRSFSPEVIRDKFVPAYEACNRALAERIAGATF